MTLDHLEFKSSVVRDAYEYWRRKRTGARLPSRRDIKPEEVAHLLPYLFLVDVTSAPVGFRFRLVGTEIIRWAAREYTGVGLNETEYGPHWRRVFDAYLLSVRTRTAQHSEYTAPWVSREFFYYERVIAPLSNDGETVDMLFGALYPVPAPSF